MTVALVLAFVTMLSVLSVPIMISGGSPTMITVDMAFRVNSYSDYGVANALGFISYLIAGLAAWIYVRHNVAGAGGGMTRHSDGCGAAACSAFSPSRFSGRSPISLLWAFAIQWYYPHKLPLDLRLPLLERGVQADQRRRSPRSAPAF